MHKLKFQKLEPVIIHDEFMYLRVVGFQDDGTLFEVRVPLGNILSIIDQGGFAVERKQEEANTTDGGEEPPGEAKGANDNVPHTAT